MSPLERLQAEELFTQPPYSIFQSFWVLCFFYLIGKKSKKKTVIHNWFLALSCISIIFGNLASINPPLNGSLSFVYPAILLSVLLSPKRGFFAVSAALLTYIIANFLFHALSENSSLRIQDLVNQVAAFLVTFLLCLGYDRLKQKYRNEIDKNENSFEQIQNELRQHSKLASMGTLLATVCHEMSTPLTIISSSVNTLKSDQPDKKNRAIERIKVSTAQLHYLVTQIKSTSRAQNPKITASTDVKNTLKIITEFYEEKVSEKNIDLAVEISPDVTTIPIDQPQFFSILQNLINNSMDSLSDISKKHRSIKIECFCSNQNSSTVIKISDNGLGMKKETLDHLFQPFFTTKAPGHGTGLGMMIVRRALDAIQGDIKVSSTPESGTTIELKFPKINEVTQIAA